MFFLFFFLFIDIELDFLRGQSAICFIKMHQQILNISTDQTNGFWKVLSYFGIDREYTWIS